MTVETRENTPRISNGSRSNLVEVRNRLIEDAVRGVPGSLELYYQHRQALSQAIDGHGLPQLGAEHVLVTKMPVKTQSGNRSTR